MPRQKIWMNDSARVAGNRALKRLRELEGVEEDVVVLVEKLHLGFQIRAATGDLKAMAVTGKTPQETSNNLVKYIKEFKDLP